MAEELGEHDGLEDACATVLIKSGIPCRFDAVAIPDEDTVTGSQADIFGHYGISMKGISERAARLLQSRQGGER